MVALLVHFCPNTKLYHISEIIKTKCSQNTETQRNVVGILKSVARKLPNMNAVLEKIPPKKGPPIPQS